MGAIAYTSNVRFWHPSVSSHSFWRPRAPSLPGGAWRLGVRVRRRRRAAVAGSVESRVSLPAYALSWSGGVGSVPSPGRDWSEEPTVGVGSAALDVVIAPRCPPGQPRQSVPPSTSTKAPSDLDVGPLNN